MTDLSTRTVLPGRLGNPDSHLGIDPRADPRLVAAIEPVGMAAPAPPSPVNAASSIEDIIAHTHEAEAAVGGLGALMLAGAPPVEGVESTTVEIEGTGGNTIKLFVHRPTSAPGPVPAIVHTHGGGMVILSAEAENYQRWRDELAATGLIAVGVEFRNGGGALGPHPFPAGLDDCAAAARWVDANRDELGVSKLVVSGESGGGNLALATTLKAKRDGWLDAIAGVYAQCPYISNAYADPPAELGSLTENDGYFLSCENMGALARAYDPDGANATNALAWPLHASADDLAGLPPHVISVNELDPLRDEGLAYFRKLLAAGVSATSRTVNGTCHAGDCIFRVALPEAYLATIHDINSFATSL